MESMGWNELDKIIQDEYPEAYYYYALGKLFRWSPDVIDELDVKLCEILIRMEMLNQNQPINNNEVGDSRTPTEKKIKTPPMPKEWEGMSVADIMKSKEFRQRGKFDENLLKAIDNTHGGQTGVVKKIMKIG